MRGLTALGGKGIKAITLSLFALGIIYIVGTFFEKAAPYVKEVSETGFYPAHDHDESTPEPLLTPEVTTLSDEDHPSSGRWHSEAMAKIKDKVGSWLPMEKIYGAMLPPPWRDHSKSMEPPSYYHAPSPPKEERNVVVGKISILNNPENEYVDRAVRVHTVHDKRHGYQHYIMREQSSTSANENFAAQMLSVLKAELSKPSSERLEWLYYFPETTIILNPNVPLEIFLPPDHNSTLEPKRLLYSSPNSKAPSQDLAHTVFAAKVHDWTVDLFTTLLSRTRTTSSKQSHSRASSSSSAGNDDDIAISSLLSLPAPLSPRAHALALPAHWLNAWPATVPLTAPPSAPTLTHSDPADPDSSNIGNAERPHQVRRGSFVLDLPLPPSNLTTNEGGSSSSSSSEDGGRWRDDDDDDYKEKKKPDEREDKKSAVLARRFEHWLARAEARMPQWEAPLQDTWYADEARGFWEGGGEDAGKKEGTPASPPSSPSPVAPPAGHADPGYTAAARGSSKGVEKLKEEAMALVREMEASVHNWRQEVSEEVRRATESRCGRAREALAEVELDGSDEDEKVRKLQVVIGGLKKASSRLNRHTSHARHVLLSTAQLTLSNATAAISTMHTQIPTSIASSNANAVTEDIKARIETVVQATLHLQSLLDRKDWSQDEVKAAVSAVEEAVARVDNRIKQVGADERTAKEIERLKQEEEKLAGMEAAEKERQRQEAEANKFTFPKPW